MERRGPHKSMHCKFCKPPGTTAPEKPSSAQLETKTKLRLTHAAADLKVFDVYDEPGVIAEESEACICQLEGYEPCPKCAPDKKRRPKKKAVCDCPLGAKPHANMAQLDRSNQKKKKQREDDDEFWWEKYDREHDAMVKETWAAYLAQRKEDKRLAKCREKEGVNMSSLMKPKWYQKLSCQQTIYLEYLATAIRLDLDENISDRTDFIVGGIGFYPRPKRKMLEKCLRYCRYNSIRFLSQLALLLQEMDPYRERVPNPEAPISKQDLYAWNDRIVMACICHLEFPKLLREIMDRLPPLPQEELPPLLPKPKFPRASPREYASPYEEPLWRERMNWVEKRKLERINRARAHLRTKVVKMPKLALVNRPSLIDARPAFLNQVEASQRYGGPKKSVRRRRTHPRKRHKPVFNSKVDVTAIAGIEASEVSTTPKADSTEICVFLREPKSEGSLEEEEEEEECEFELKDEEGEEKKVEVTREEQVQDTRSKVTDKISAKSSSVREEEDVADEGEGSSDEEDIPFVTPPKTGSGVTIEEPCPPPRSSPGPPVPHYAEAKKELGLINKELCAFDANSDRSDDDEKGPDEGSILSMNIEDQLKEVALKLKELNMAEGEEEEEEEEEEKMQQEQFRVPPKKEKLKKKGKGKALKTEKKERKKRKKAKNVTPKYDETVISEPQTDTTTENVEERRELDKGEGICLCGKDKQKKKKKEKGKKKSKSQKGKQSKKGKKGKVDPCARDTEGENLSYTDSDKSEVGSSVSDEEETGSGVEMEESQMETIPSSEVRVEAEEDKTFRGDVEPLLKSILKDLSDEGFISAGYEEMEEHPDIKQLIKHLQGEIVRDSTKKKLHISTRLYWRYLEKMGKAKAAIPDLNISQKKFDSATWNDKNWILNLAKKKKEEFYFNVAKIRTNESKDFYLTLFQEYFGSERFLKSYYAYMIPKRQECIMRGLH